VTLTNETTLDSTISAAVAQGLAGEHLDRHVWEKHGTTCAMLALDGSGMTRVSRSHGIVHFLARYQEMRAIAVVALERHRCRAWRGFADNLFAEFDDTDTALRAALEIHGALAEHALMLTDGEPYLVCIGIGHGRVLRNGNAGVMGDEMNLTAKLAEDIAAGGETLLTEAAYQTLQAGRVGVTVQKKQDRISRVDVTYFAVKP